MCLLAIFISFGTLHAPMTILANGVAVPFEVRHSCAGPRGPCSPVPALQSSAAAWCCCQELHRCRYSCVSPPSLVGHASVRLGSRTGIKWASGQQLVPDKPALPQAGQTLDTDAWAAQLLLIVPFMRFGEVMLHSPPMTTKPAALFDILFHNPGELSPVFPSPRILRPVAAFARFFILAAF